MNTKFFFGANTPRGFKGYLDELYSPYTDKVILIKGSPGNGKNTVMKKVLNKLYKENVFCEEIRCSSDPSSLDGIIVPSMKKCIFDATAPHVMEPKYWGACETIADLSHCLHRDILGKYSEKLFSLIDKCSYEHRLCCCEMAKANLIKETYFAETEKSIDKKEIIRAAIDTAEKLLPTKSGFPKETRRFLSAVSPGGITFFADTLKTLSDTQIVFYDEFCLCAPLFLSTIACVADDKNLSYISCRNPFSPNEIDHIIFPEEKVAFSVSNEMLPRDSFSFCFEEFIKRPISIPYIKSKEYIRNAVAHSAAAKEIHDEIEELYKKAMDFEKADRIAESVLDFFS